MNFQSEDLQDNRPLTLLLFDYLSLALAAIALLSGLACWLVLLGLFPDNLTPLTDRPRHDQSLIIVMAFLAPTAFIGLIQRARWGHVLWIILSLTLMGLIAFDLVSLAYSMLIFGFFLVLIALQVILMFKLISFQAK